jgi:hypothetical protein
MVVEGETQGLGIEAVDLLLELLECEPPEVSGAVVSDRFPAAGLRLVGCGALREVANAFTVTCRACDADHSAEVEFDASVHGYRHFCPEAGWVKVESEDLKQYLLDVSWLLRQIARAMKIRSDVEPRCLVDDVLWDLGDAWIRKRNIAVLFGRRLNHGDNLDRAIDALTNRIGRPPGILLSTTERLSRHVRLPGRHHFLPLRDCLVVGASELEIDWEIIKGVTGGAVRREGFSTGYRTAFIDGVEYKFSKKQAAVVEALDNAGGPVHKDELLAAADTDQTELIQVFRSKGKRHPAWGVLILHDNQGNYFLRR